MQSQHHTFHIRTKFSFMSLFLGLALGSGVAYTGNYFYKKIDSRFTTLETEILTYKKRMWVFKVVDEKLSDQKSQTRYEVADCIYSLSKVKGVPVEIILGMIEVESGWDLGASNGAAIGALQITPVAASKQVKAGKADIRKVLYDPVTNVTAGVSHLATLHEDYVKRGVEKKDEFGPSLCAYNSGRILGDSNKQLTNYGYAMKVREAASNYEAKFKTPLD